MYRTVGADPAMGSSHATHAGQLLLEGKTTAQVHAPKGIGRLASNKWDDDTHTIMMTAVTRPNLHDNTSPPALAIARAVGL